jgi:hypothetical protein
MRTNPHPAPCGRGPGRRERCRRGDDETERAGRGRFGAKNANDFKDRFGAAAPTTDRGAEAGEPGFIGLGRRRRVGAPAPIEAAVERRDHWRRRPRPL